MSRNPPKSYLELSLGQTPEFSLVERLKNLEQLQNASQSRLRLAILKGDMNGHRQFPSDMSIDNIMLYEALEKAYMMGRDRVDAPLQDQTMVDVGCGDGFPSIIASMVGYDARGIDRENLLVRNARSNALIAQKTRIISSQPLYVEGNAHTLNDYATLGGFENIDVFYMFPVERLLEGFLPMFNQHAKRGARLILVPGLNEKRIRGIAETLPSIELVYQDVEENRYQIYMKRDI